MNQLQNSMHNNDDSIYAFVQSFNNLIENPKTMKKLQALIKNYCKLNNIEKLNENLQQFTKQIIQQQFPTAQEERVDKPCFLNLFINCQNFEIPLIIQYSYQYNNFILNNEYQNVVFVIFESENEILSVQEKLQKLFKKQDDIQVISIQNEHSLNNQVDNQLNQVNDKQKFNIILLSIDMYNNLKQRQKLNAQVNVLLIYNADLYTIQELKQIQIILNKNNISELIIQSSGSIQNTYLNSFIEQLKQQQVRSHLKEAVNSHITNQNINNFLINSNDEILYYLRNIVNNLSNNRYLIMTRTDTLARFLYENLLNTSQQYIKREKDVLKQIDLNQIQSSSRIIKKSILNQNNQQQFQLNNSNIIYISDNLTKSQKQEMLCKFGNEQRIMIISDQTRQYLTINNSFDVAISVDIPINYDYLLKRVIYSVNKQFIQLFTQQAIQKEIQVIAQYIQLMVQNNCQLEQFLIQQLKQQMTMQDDKYIQQLNDLF